MFRQHGQRLWRSIYAYAGGSREVADESVAEAFARALVYKDRIRDPLPWLYRVAFRIAAKELKRQRRGEELRDTVSEIPHDPLGVLLPALRQLSPAQRAAVYLHYQADRPIREVADLLGTSVQAVKVHLYRARRRLRTILAEEEHD